MKDKIRLEDEYQGEKIKSRNRRVIEDKLKLDNCHRERPISQNNSIRARELVYKCFMKQITIILILNSTLSSRGGSTT